jgi:hypothetical protein
MKPHDENLSLRDSSLTKSLRTRLRLALAASTLVLLALAPTDGATINGHTPYLNGANVPWNDFGTDFGTSNYSSTWFNNAFAAMHAAGVNSARIWLHCDGRATPTFNGSGDVTGLSSTCVSNLQDMLNKANANGIKIYLSLWSFDLFNNNHANLVSNTTYTQDYITKALNPILSGIVSYPALAVIEIMNEPEWAVSQTPNTTTQSVTLAQMQTFVKSIATAIHAKTTSINVTLGSASVKWSTANGKDATVGDWWANLGLDHRDVHYYGWMTGNGYNYDPLKSGHTPTYYGWTVPAVVGEFAAKGDLPYSFPLQMMNGAYNNGFAGHMPWSYAGVDSEGSFSNFSAAATSFASSPGVGPKTNYDFESSTQGWGFQSGAGSVATSTTEWYSGTHSLKATFSSATQGIIGVYSPSPNPAGKTIAEWVWIPSGSPLNGLQAYVEYGSGYTWLSGTWVSASQVTSNAWNEVFVTAPSGQTIQAVGVNILFNSAYSGSYYIDAVTY